MTDSMNGSKRSFFPQSIHIGSGTHPATSMATVGLSSAVKWLAHDYDDHSPLPRAAVKKYGYNSTHLYAFRAYVRSNLP